MLHSQGFSSTTVSCGSVQPLLTFGAALSRRLRSPSKTVASKTCRCRGTASEAQVQACGLNQLRVQGAAVDHPGVQLCFSHAGCLHHLVDTGIVSAMMHCACALCTAGAAAHRVHTAPLLCSASPVDIMAHCMRAVRGGRAVPAAAAAARVPAGPRRGEAKRESPSAGWQRLRCWPLKAAAPRPRFVAASRAALPAAAAAGCPAVPPAAAGRSDRAHLQFAKFQAPPVTPSAHTPRCDLLAPEPARGALRCLR